MTTWTRFALVMTLALAVAGCRQPDGATPTPSGDQNNEIGDIARDLQNIVGGDAQAPNDLSDDLSKYAATEDTAAQVHELSRVVSTALNGARLDDATAQRLAQTLWLGVTGKEFSERQVLALRSDVTSALTSAGVAEQRAQPVADRLSEVQKRITENPKRWYHVF